MTPAPLPWDRIIGFGLGVLRLSPDAFWRMTLREFTHAANVAMGVSAALDRETFSNLMQRFPDRAQRTGHSDG